MHVRDAVGVPLGNRDGVDAGERQVARIEEEPQCRHRREQAVKLRCTLNHRSHVVMINELRLLGGGDSREMFEARDELRPLGFRQPRAIMVAEAERGIPRAVDAARAFGHDRHPRAEGFQQREVRTKGFFFVLERTRSEVGAMPPADESEIMTAQCLRQRGGCARIGVAQLAARITRRAHLAENRVQRQIPVELVKVVVAPDDRVGSDQAVAELPVAVRGVTRCYSPRWFVPQRGLKPRATLGGVTGAARFHQ